VAIGLSQAQFSLTAQALSRFSIPCHDPLRETRRLAPLIGPLVDQESYVAAALVARTVNATIAAGLVVAIIWGVRQACPANIHLAIAAGLVAACNTWVVRVGGSVYNDGFAAIWATLMMAMTVRLIRRGFSWRRFSWLGLFGAAGLLSRASVAVVLFVCLSVLLVQAWRRRNEFRLAHSLAGLVGVGASAALVSSWFYLRNLRLTGGVFGGHPEWAQEHLGRTEKPLAELIIDFRIWERLLAIFSHNPLNSSYVMLLLVVAPLTLGIITAIVRDRPNGWVPRGSRSGNADPMVVAALTLPVLAVLIQQGMYMASGGGSNARYLMIVLLPACLAIAFGLTRWRGAKDEGGDTLPLAIWAAIAQFDYAFWMITTTNTQPPDAPGTNWPSAWLFLSCALSAVGVVLLWMRQSRLGREHSSAPVSIAPSEPM
jgi:4-amino-4-deoxy-L-arabinose transferase-like glycosyltransferase